MFVNEGDYYNYSEMITHVPMLSNKMPKAVLVIGGGTGTIAKEVLKYDTVEKVVIVDIDEMVIETSKKYLLLLELNRLGLHAVGAPKSVLVSHCITNTKR